MLRLKETKEERSRRQTEEASPGKLHWYRVTFTTNNDQPIEWYIYLSATSAEWAKYAAKVLWADNGSIKPLSNLKARRIRTPGDRSRTYEFMWVRPPKQEETL